MVYQQVGPCIPGYRIATRLGECICVNCIKNGSHTSSFWPVSSSGQFLVLNWNAMGRLAPWFFLKVFLFKVCRVRWCQSHKRKPFFFFFFVKVSCIPGWPPICYVAKVDRVLLILLPWLPPDWGDKCEAPCLLQCHAGNQAQGLVHVRQAFGNWVTSLASTLLFFHSVSATFIPGGFLNFALLESKCFSSCRNNHRVGHSILFRPL